jgi:hypothetical protein
MTLAPNLTSISGPPLAGACAPPVALWASAMDRVRNDVGSESLEAGCIDGRDGRLECHHALEFGQLMSS